MLWTYPLTAVGRRLSNYRVCRVSKYPEISANFHVGRIRLRTASLFLLHLLAKTILNA